MQINTEKRTGKGKLFHRGPSPGPSAHRLRKENLEIQLTDAEASTQDFTSPEAFSPMPQEPSPEAREPGNDPSLHPPCGRQHATVGNDGEDIGHEVPGAHGRKRVGALKQLKQAP